MAISDNIRREEAGQRTGLPGYPFSVERMKAEKPLSARVRELAESVSGHAMSVPARMDYIRNAPEAHHEAQKLMMRSLFGNIMKFPVTLLEAYIVDAGMGRGLSAATYRLSVNPTLTEFVPAYIKNFTFGYDEWRRQTEVDETTATLYAMIESFGRHDSRVAAAMEGARDSSFTRMEADAALADDAVAKLNNGGTLTPSEELALGRFIESMNTVSREVEWLEARNPGGGKPASEAGKMQSDPSAYIRDVLRKPEVETVDDALIATAFIASLLIDSRAREGDKQHEKRKGFLFDTRQGEQLSAELDDILAEAGMARNYVPEQLAYSKQRQGHTPQQRFPGAPAGALIVLQDSPPGFHVPEPEELIGVANRLLGATHRRAAEMGVDIERYLDAAESNLPVVEAAILQTPGKEVRSLAASRDVPKYHGETNASKVRGSNRWLNTVRDDGFRNFVYRMAGPERGRDILDRFEYAFRDQIMGPQGEAQKLLKRMVSRQVMIVPLMIVMESVLYGGRDPMQTGEKLFRGLRDNYTNLANYSDNGIINLFINSANEATSHLPPQGIFEKVAIHIPGLASIVEAHRDRELTKSLNESGIIQQLDIFLSDKKNDKLNGKVILNEGYDGKPPLMESARETYEIPKSAFFLKCVITAVIYSAIEFFSVPFREFTAGYSNKKARDQAENTAELLDHAMVMLAADAAANDSKWTKALAEIAEDSREGFLRLAKDKRFVHLQDATRLVQAQAEGGDLASVPTVSGISIDEARSIVHDYNESLSQQLTRPWEVFNRLSAEGHEQKTPQANLERLVSLEEITRPADALLALSFVATLISTDAKHITNVDYVPERLLNKYDMQTLTRQIESAMAVNVCKPGDKLPLEHLPEGVLLARDASGDYCAMDTENLCSLATSLMATVHNRVASEPLSEAVEKHASQVVDRAMQSVRVLHNGMQVSGRSMSAD